MEYKDIYDKFRCATGKAMLRGDTSNRSGYSLAVRIWLVNERGELLIQQRQRTKARWAGRWDCTVAGGVLQGENTLQAALRECREELGLSLHAQELEPLFTVMDGNRFDDLFLVRKNLDLYALTLQEEEVAAVRWVAAAEVQALLASGQFVPYSFFDKLSAVLRSNLVFEAQPPYIVAWHGGVCQARMNIAQDGQGRLTVALALEQPDFLQDILMRIEIMHPEATLCEVTLTHSGANAEANAACVALGYHRCASNVYCKESGLCKIDQQVFL